MKRVSISLSWLLLALTLCGLSSRYTIKVEQQGALPTSFQFERSGLSKGGVEVNTFLVVKRSSSGQWDYKKPAWEFGLSPGSAISLSHVTYGQVPAGFKEAKEAMPLERGAHYLAVGLAPGSGGSVEFVVQ